MKSAIASWVWKETAKVLGVLGIIAGIVFLGFELSQNNDLLAAQPRYNLIVQRADMNDTFTEPFNLEVLHKYESGAELTPVERSVVFSLMARLRELPQEYSGFSVIQARHGMIHRHACHSERAFARDDWKYKSLEYLPGFESYVDA